MTIVEFLTERLDEDKAVVQSEPRWADPGYELQSQFGDYGDTERFMIEIGAARVLAEIAAKRRIIEWALVFAEDVDGEWGDGHTAAQIKEGQCTGHGSEAALSLLRLLAQPYADHPDFDPAWSVA